LKTIFVGNLPFTTTTAEITQLFSQHGTVNSVTLIYDKERGRPKGFCFVEMDKTGAESAIENLNGQLFGGRQLKVETRFRDLENNKKRGSMGAQA
jgi:RNA recognition motif-containing protein